MWHNKIKINPSAQQFNHEEKILSLGSCFADEMAIRLNELHFDIHSNPFGILYNPASLAKVFGYFSGRLKWDESTSFSHENKWRHFDFHSRVSKKDRDEFINHINEEVIRGAKQLQEASLIILTLGTAFVWEKIDGTIVGNCHKLPADQFNRRLLEAEEINSSLKGIMTDIRSVNKKALVIFTVSPVRHSRDGMVNNNWSKARLLDACHSLVNNEGAHYFPSYEILLDELRDYRFYRTDRMHPTAEATDYIFERFFEIYFSSVSEELLRLIKKINNNLAHRPFDANSKRYNEHAEKTTGLIRSLELKFGIEIEYPRH